MVVTEFESRALGLALWHEGVIAVSSGNGGPKTRSDAQLSLIRKLWDT